MPRSNARSSLSVSRAANTAISWAVLPSTRRCSRLVSSVYVWRQAIRHWWLADVVFLAFAFVQVALLGHDIAHLQFVRAGRLNSALGLVLGNLLVGGQPGVVGRQPQRAPCSTKRHR